jgi:hypothetical protein
MTRGAVIREVLNAFVQSPWRERDRIASLTNGARHCKSADGPRDPFLERTGLLLRVQSCRHHIDDRAHCQEHDHDYNRRHKS